MTQAAFAIDPRLDPRISINKLAEYLGASPARRQTIVRDQKNPSAIKSPYYNDAENAIRSFFAKNKDYAVLEEAMSELGQRAPQTVLRDQMASKCLDALAAFADTGLDPLNGYTVAVLPRSQPKLLYRNVAVSVRPEVLLKRDNGDATVVGVLKLYFSKGDPLSDEGGKYVAAACLEHLTQHLSDGGQPDHKAVFVLDVLAKKFFQAPRATKKRLRDIEAACGEIAAVWSAV